ncbi:MAG: DUF4114 domain-containing protein [Candidatus Krumholzibacteriia bacterium]
MKPLHRGLPAVCAALYLVLAAPAMAQVSVVFGTTWDNPPITLQDILDAEYGVGTINIANDYIGKSAGNPDPFIFSGTGLSGVIIREVAGFANNNILGWYEDTGVMPVIDGIDDGVVFDGPTGQGELKMIDFGGGVLSFGFYMNPNGTGDARNAPEPELFFSNRFYNDLGPDGSGTIHEPFDADVQALVFDVSSIVGQPNTWVVAFEDLDSGADPGPCCATTDSDFNDLVFEVTVAQTVAVEEVAMSVVKRLYR